MFRVIQGEAGDKSVSLCDNHTALEAVEPEWQWVFLLWCEFSPHHISFCLVSLLSGSFKRIVVRRQAGLLFVPPGYHTASFTPEIVTHKLY